MRRIIYGETPNKTSFHNRKEIDQFIEKNRLDFEKTDNDSVFLYEKDLNFISDN